MGDTQTNDAYELPSGARAEGRVLAPVSKSHAIRTLVCAALHEIDDDGPPLTWAHDGAPDDVWATARALRELGWGIETTERSIQVEVYEGPLPPVPALLDVGGSGTALRFLAAVCALGPGPFTIGGKPQLLRRPAGGIVNALRSLKVSVKGECGGSGGTRPPLVISGGPPQGGEVSVDASASSQAVSALLLIGPMLARGLVVRPQGAVASGPYIGLTLRTMRAWGATVEAGPEGWTVAPGGYGDPDDAAGEIEGDWSSAAYLLAASAVTDGRVEVTGLDPASEQPDRRIVGLLAEMGADVFEFRDGASCRGRASEPVDVDLRDAPDLAPLVGALGCLVGGRTTVRGAAHLRIKETDRIASVVRCARAFGCAAEEREDGFVIDGGTAKGALIDPEGDHRLAMAFAVAGLAVPGTRIANPSCVAKSFPSFWQTLEGLTGQSFLVAPGPGEDGG